MSGRRQDGMCSAFHPIRWNQQGTRVLQQLRVLYSTSQGLGTGLQPDVVLFSSDGGCLEAHKMVLSLCSPYFQDLLWKISQTKSQRMKDGPAVVILANVKTPVLKHLLQFIYTGEVNLPVDQMSDFMEIGKLFQIEGITPQNLASTSSSENPSAQIPVPQEQEEDISYDGYPYKMEPQDFIDENVSDHQDSSDQDLDRNKNDNANASWEFGACNNPPQERVSKRNRPSTYNRQQWQVHQFPVTEDMLKTEWRPLRADLNLPNPQFYCAIGGYKCPALLRKKILTDGDYIWMNNGMEHANHRRSGVHGLTPEQKRYVMECVDDKVFSTTDIILKFQVKGLPPPKREKLSTWLSNYRRTHPDKFMGWTPRNSGFPGSSGQERMDYSNEQFMDEFSGGQQGDPLGGGAGTSTMTGMGGGGGGGIGAHGQSSGFPYFLNE